MSFNKPNRDFAKLFSWRTFERAVWLAVLCTTVAIAATAMSATSLVIDPNNENSGNLSNALIFGNAGVPTHIGELSLTGTGISSNRVAARPPSSAGPGFSGLNLDGLDFYTGSVARMSLTYAGKLGVGTQLPQQTITAQSSSGASLGLGNTVTGHVWTLTSYGSSPASESFLIGDAGPGGASPPRLSIDANGQVAVTTLQIKGGSDLAEPFPTSTGHLVPGTVVVIDSDHPGQIKLSDRAYDPRVAGVVSGANGIYSGIKMNSATPNGGKDIALSGRVYARASASRAAIRPGDLLTTADERGYCMKATDFAKMHGAILGKAMSKLDRGTGYVLVLVSLQ